MKVVGYMGSPRRRGNTETLLDAILAGAREAGAEVVKVPLAARKFSGCRNCGGCDVTGRCVVKDDMQALYEDLAAASQDQTGATRPNLVLASPVFFAGLSSQSKAMIDRCQALWVRRYRLGIKPEPGRRALLASVCGMPRPDMFDAPLAVARTWFATLGAKPLTPLLVPEIDARGDMGKDEPTLARAFAAGRWLAGGPEPSFKERAPGFLRGERVWLRPRRPVDAEVWENWDWQGRQALGDGPDAQEWVMVLPKAGTVGGVTVRLDGSDAAPATVVAVDRRYRAEGSGAVDLETDALETIRSYLAAMNTSSSSPVGGAGEKGQEKR